MSDITVVWFKRDLRVADHAALSRAAGMGPVVPLYIWEPDLWAQPDASGRQMCFVRESLADLREALAGLGLTLCERTGAAVDVLSALQRDCGFTTMISHEETGNAWSFARDRAVAGWARGAGVCWQELAGCGVVRRMNGRDGWARTRDGYMAQPLDQAEGASGPVLLSDPVPDLIGPDYCPQRQRGGREAGLETLHSFLDHRGRTYRRDMSSPLQGARACSRISPHLAFGTLSVREVAQEAVGARDAEWAKSLKSFQSRLAWRDHFMQKLEDEPRLEYRCLHSAYEGMRPAVPDAERLAAWSHGQTGLPFVDACMRSLQATGWLNFRMRAMVVAVASYHLWLDWRATGPVLARLFTDYEPGIHWSQMQMQSGVTGMNTVRIYNPVKQGKDQDPDGVFTRTWVPELAAVPDMYLQEPWLWAGAGRLPYPAPVVDVASAARFARETVYGVRRGGAFHAEAARVVEKHASRKDRAGRFVRDPVRRQKTVKADPRQKGFDF